MQLAAAILDVMQTRIGKHFWSNHMGQDLTYKMTLMIASKKAQNYTREVMPGA